MTKPLPVREREKWSQSFIFSNLEEEIFMVTTFLSWLKFKPSLLQERCNKLLLLESSLTKMQTKLLISITANGVLFIFCTFILAGFLISYYIYPQCAQYRFHRTLPWKSPKWPRHRSGRK